jgi:DNA-binding MarR family transcriptional regulator
MRTFYDIPESLVVEYIYHHECINLNELADRLYLKTKTVQSYIEKFKRDKYIIEEHRSNEVFYKIDIATFVNVVKRRLIKMQSTTEDIERQQIRKEINYKCQQCLREYTARDLEQLSKYSSGGDSICTWCNGIVNENDRNEPIVNMRLFNEQMARLFEILERIDEIMRNEHLIEIHCDTEVNSQKDDVDKYCPNVDIELIRSRDEITAKPLQGQKKLAKETIPYESKSLPEWFLDKKSGDEVHHINS